MVPFVDLKAQYHSLKAEIDRAMTEVIESSSFIRGPALAAFEREFAAAVGARHAIGVASGTDALNLALRALDLGPGDEAITVPNTWISTAFAVSHAGAQMDASAPISKNILARRVSDEAVQKRQSKRVAQETLDHGF